VLVLDPSVAAKWFLNDEKNAAADRVFDRIQDGESAWAPEIFRWEIQNMLLSAERSGRIEPDEVEEALAVLRDLPVHLEVTGDRFFAGSEVHFARAYDLSLYDAAYVVCAAALVGELVTADVSMEHAARDLGLRTTLVG
jgi:predicted nucleic acid-binding protein